ncbi:MAG TPA: TRP-like protein [Polyangiaceae bacterium]|nr:TRP-like protein [Polyangiaceae bacterium]
MALATKPGGDANAALVRSDVLVLLREKRYEEALARLYQARAETPDNAELQKGIDQVKEFLIGAYAKRLGGLDQIAEPIPPVAGRSPDMVLLARYIDGTSTYGDLAEMCPLGRLRTLQVLIEMYPRQAPVSSSTLAEPEPEPETERSASSMPLAVEAPEARAYREAFTRGTAAFIQLRFADAIEAFEQCDRLRPGDAAAAVMLRRVRRDMASH